MNSHDHPHVVLVLEKPDQHFSESFRFAARSRRTQLSIMYWTDNIRGQFDEGFARHVNWDVRHLWLTPSAFRQRSSLWESSRAHR
jgi:hypothetical protein